MKLLRRALGLEAGACGAAGQVNAALGRLLCRGTPVPPFCG